MKNVWMPFLILALGLCANGETHCQHVGGAVATNFIDSSTTLGTATGDLKGGLGVSVLSFQPNPDGSLTFYNQHHWVTESGDTIQLEAAYATGYPTPVAGLYAARYNDGVRITGGTGKFANATGKIDSWGAVDLTNKQVVLRYEGRVCFASPDRD